MFNNIKKTTKFLLFLIPIYLIFSVFLNVYYIEIKNNLFSRVANDQSISYSSIRNGFNYKNEFPAVINYSNITPEQIAPYILKFKSNAFVNKENAFIALLAFKTISEKHFHTTTLENKNLILNSSINFLKWRIEKYNDDSARGDLAIIYLLNSIGNMEIILNLINKTTDQHSQNIYFLVTSGRAFYLLKTIDFIYLLNLKIKNNLGLIIN